MLTEKKLYWNVAKNISFKKVLFLNILYRKVFKRENKSCHKLYPDHVGTFPEILFFVSPAY